eukprot:CAMPEP_0183741384 /NCGR_PEP_ID=MMETSP0737-20130205/61999_1 /TAXON_ID=385413 /ORGANISM="Thalassiosira miniscula, Strain CCMP1093" /LENGTH=274 /DNA_ID=CAMNT_0025976701 /DNA_START=87 /DNA_END=908 /DNA_ORIENTATION=+
MYAPIVIITLLNVPIVVTLLIVVLAALMPYDDNKKRRVGATDEEDTCWLCLDAKHESGQPLRRDCGCKGGSGFVHFPCLVEFAKIWSEQSHLHRRRDSMNKFVEPWCACLNCHQFYRNQLALDLVNEFVSFTEEKYPGDQWKNREAHRCKLFVLSSDWSKPERREEAKQIAKRILSMVEPMKAVDSLEMKKNVVRIEVHVYSCLGFIFLKEGTKEGAKTAMGYYEKCRDLTKSVGFAAASKNAERSLTIAKSFYKGDSSLAAYINAKKHHKPVW